MSTLIRIFGYEAIEEAKIDVESILYRDYSLEEKLPWDMISLGVSKTIFKKMNG